MTPHAEAEIRQLLDHHGQHIRRCAVTEEVVRARGDRSVTTKAELKRLGFTDAQCRVPALLLPIHGVFGGIVNYQIRPDEPRIGRDGRPLKYELTAGSRMALDAHPSIRENLCDPTKPLWITEGIFKADAAISVGLCCIAVLGVWNWRGTNEVGGKAALPDWEAIALNGRQIYIVYDSDVMLKPKIHQALARFGAFLASRGAHVAYVYLPSGPGGIKTGLDDYLAAGHGVDELLALASTTLRTLPGDEANPDQLYAATEVGTIWRKPTADGPVDVLLANFSAVISEDVTEDDGAEERRVYVLEGTVHGKRQRIEIPAAHFAGMSWVGERLGASAVLEPGLGTKDRFRHAIQTLSREIPQRRVYAHTGWRLIDGAWGYLHGTGAIGPDGPISGVEVGLRGPLTRFALPDPPSGEALVEAIRAALRLLQLVPAEVAYSLLGTTWLAPLRELLGDDAPDFVVWLHGPSGTFKSELLALAQGFYGDFSRQSLPVNFSATPNALERFLFEAKDALLAVDDFHPAGDLREQQAMNQVASRLLRGAGNLAGRARMRADTTLRPALTPRCLAMASGERLPEGHSTVARMFPIAIARGAIDPRHLTTVQAQRHRFPFALAGYLQYLAQEFATLQLTLPLRFRELRGEMQVAGGHRREPGQLAHLVLGLGTFLDFAVEIGAITSEDRDAHLQQARQVLVAQAREHAEAEADEVPERLFLRSLSDGLAGKRIYLEAKQGGAPEEAEVWGWEKISQRDSLGIEQETWRHPLTAQLVGVLDGEWLLLYPEQVFQFAVGAAKAAGQTFPVDQNTLIRRLDEAGFIAAEIESGERRRKVNVWIGGATRRVLKLRRDAVVPSPGEDREEREGREGPAPAGTDRDAPPSHPSGNGSKTGKVSPADDCAVVPILPDLPALPGFETEGDATASETKAMVEWRG